VRIGLAYNLKRVQATRGGLQDQEAEFDSRPTVEAIANAVASFGHEVVELEADRTFPHSLLVAQPHAVFNIAEGTHGRSREAHVPALLELLGIPYTGSDPASLVLTLDKGLATSVVRSAGVRAPRSVAMARGDEPLPEGFTFPAIVKPVAEGSSKGIFSGNVTRSEQAARELARYLALRYEQPALVEEYLPGREFTVAVLGNPATALPPMEVVHAPGVEFPVYSFDHKLEPSDGVRYEVPAQVGPELDQALRALALRAFALLGCRDVARIDVRLDAEGRPAFIECNPLPGLSPGLSDLCLIATAANIEYRALIGTILAPAVRRVRTATSVSSESMPLSL
jgi:D-alanine-D-alanine ligase